MKMKNILRFLLFFVLVLKIYSQTTVKENGFTITWESENYKFKEYSEGSFIIRDYYEFTDPSSPGSFKLPAGTLIIAIPDGSRPSFSVSEIVEKREAGIVPQKNPEALIIDEKLNYKDSDNYTPVANYEEMPLTETIGYFYLRDYYCVKLKINSHRIDRQTGELIITEKFNLNVNTGNIPVSRNLPIPEKNGFDKNLKHLIANSDIAGQFKTNRQRSDNPADNSWINFNAEYVKIGVTEDGIYQLRPSDFSTLGLSTYITIPSLKMHHNGSLYPVFIKDADENGYFDGNDYLEFYAEKNYGSPDYRETNDFGEEYKEYMDRYSDENIFWLSWEEGRGYNVYMQPAYITNLADTLDYHSDILHYEKNKYFDYSSISIVERQKTEWLKNETWVGGQFRVGASIRTWTITDPVPGKTALSLFKVQDYASDIIENAHVIGMWINDDTAIYDSIPFDRFEQHVVTALFPSDLLFNGENDIHIESYETGSSINSVAVDWWELEYPRYNIIYGDSIKMIIPPGYSNNIVNIKVRGISGDDYLVYKKGTTIKKIVDIMYRGEELIFQDTVTTGDVIFISKPEGIFLPDIKYKKRFSSISSKRQAEYILITNSGLIEKGNEYASFVENTYGINSYVVDVQDIYDEFNYGNFSPEPIKDFLFEIYQNFEEPKPSWTFLVGEANYDYKNNLNLETPVQNVVPSYGRPVSDSWFVIWDEVSALQQMMVGRITPSTVEEFDRYLNKHRGYVEQDFDLWNKSFLLLSGGLDEAEQQAAKAINTRIKENIVTPAPFGGYTTQFYATENPPTNFGPYEQEFVDSVFASGAVIISYIGHSGTKIWDNGIEEPAVLSNERGKGSLISDFGCSTGKFAEPDVVSFSERFTIEDIGQAIAYIGNSSLGFTSISSIFPELYYEGILVHDKLCAGEAHMYGKSRLLEIYGNSDVNKIFNHSNVLFCDPVLELKIPILPDLGTSVADLTIPDFIDDNLDSVEFRLSYYNMGKVEGEAFVMKISDYFEGGVAFEKIIELSQPLTRGEIYFNIPVKERAGEHSLIITLDPGNMIEEINEDNNLITINYTVFSSSVRSFTGNKFNLRQNGSFLYLNPVRAVDYDTIYADLAGSSDFSSFTTYAFGFDTLVTLIEFPPLDEDKRYWFRTYLDKSTPEYFETISFVYDPDSNYYYAFSDTLAFSLLNREDVIYDENGLSLGDKEILLSISSNGVDDGGNANLELDGVDYSNSVIGCGFNVLVIDELTRERVDDAWFNYWSDQFNYPAFVDYLNTITSGQLVAIAVSNFCGGYHPSEELKIKLREFGSSLIDSVDDNHSFFMLGKPGATPGTIPEAVSTVGSVAFDTAFAITAKRGYLHSGKIGNVHTWGSLAMERTIPDGASIEVTPVVYTTPPDTLDPMELTGSSTSLNVLNSYPAGTEVSFIVDYFANELYQSPVLELFGVTASLPPDLAVNFQTFSLDNDFVDKGEKITLSFDIYNPGGVKAENIGYLVEVINPDNSKVRLSESQISVIESGGKENISLDYTTLEYEGEGKFRIAVDPENNIEEMFEDNNSYQLSFYVAADTVKPDLTMTIEGGDIIQGQIITPDPYIKAELTDTSLIPVTSTDAIRFYLNSEKVDPQDITYSFSQENPKVVAEYRPHLEDGEYILTVGGEDGSGNIADSSGLEKIFQVYSQLELIDLYNYPNPFKDETWFTFKLGTIPEEISIRIYTVTGRLIRDITILPEDMNYDFNRIYWDGKDEDGDLIANGVYLYKVVTRKGEKTVTYTQKLAVVR